MKLVEQFLSEESDKQSKQIQTIIFKQQNFQKKTNENNLPISRQVTNADLELRKQYHHVSLLFDILQIPLQPFKQS